jgi:predicted DNA-binding protein (MmcQ/YjbR family)
MSPWTAFLFFGDLITTFLTMELDVIREYCLGKEGKIKEDMPFGEDVLVFRIEGKIFALLMITNRPLTVNLKCDPELAIELRERYASVLPGYHMNKKMWNTVVLDGSVPNKEIRKMIDHSYDEVVKGIPKPRKRNLKTVK